jgi:hypothetical protein
MAPATSMDDIRTEAVLDCSYFAQPLFIDYGPVWHGSRAKLQGGAGQSMPNTLTPEL